VLSTEKEINGFSGPSDALKRAVVILREEGLRKFLLRALDLAKVYRRVLLMSSPLDEPIPEITPGLPIVMRLLEESEIDEYIAFRPEVSPNDIRSRLRSGQLCFTVRYEGKIIDAGWATTCPFWSGYLEHEISPASDGFLHFDAFTLPSFRNRHVETARIAEMLRHFRNRGYRSALATAVPENAYGLRLLEECGYRPSGSWGS
jgi:GNAT superfamily N-acetyltransferase